jgi:hypothetical protein
MFASTVQAANAPLSEPDLPNDGRLVVFEGFLRFG